MLLWQPQNSLRVRSVFLVSLVLHLVVCFSLLFVYKDYHQRLVVDLSSRIPSNAIVKLLPLSASRSSSQVLGVKGGGKKSKKGASSSVKATQDRQKPGNKNKAQSSSTALASKKRSPTSLVKQSVTSKSAKAAKNKVEAEKKAKTLLQEKKQKLAEKKKESVRKQEEKRAQEKKASDLAKASTDKKDVPKEEGKVLQKPVKEEQKIESSQQPIIDQASLGETGGNAIGPEGQEIVYVTKQEFDALQLQQKLQECLFDLWTPPAGIPSGVACEVLITVGWDGAILETQFLKKTDILMYDLSVQETLEQVIFPHEVWGKQITIAFKP